MRGLGRAMVAVVVVGAAWAAWHARAERPIMPTVAQAPVTVGDVVQVVSATGTLAPARSVAVGAQVSGVVTHLLVDYNAVVKAGEVLAEIDPEKARTQLELAEAGRTQAASALEVDAVRRESDERSLERISALLEDEQETLDDRDTAQLAVQVDDARLKQDQTAIANADAAIEQARIALQHCTIASPISGVVVARDVDEGQTLNATVVSPTIYELASDLTTLQLVAATDEADVAKVTKGEIAHFTVDAQPGVTFTGVVRELRLNPTTINNVVTYQTIIDVRNPDLRLRPGMTAHIVIDAGRASNVLRVPVSALRFFPTGSAAIAFPGTVLPTRPPTAPVIAKGATAQLWKVDGARLVPVTITLGVSDGTLVEVTAGDLRASDTVITSIITPKRR